MLIRVYEKFCWILVEIELLIFFGLVNTDFYLQRFFQNENDSIQKSVTTSIFPIHSNFISTKTPYQISQPSPFKPLQIKNFFISNLFLCLSHSNPLFSRFHMFAKLLLATFLHTLPKCLEQE
jgi:hypothetical protein